MLISGGPGAYIHMTLLVLVVGFNVGSATYTSESTEQRVSLATLNGEYHPDGQYNGKTMYMNQRSSAIMYFDDKAKQWKLNDKDDKETYLCATDDVPVGNVPWSVGECMEGEWTSKRSEEGEAQSQDSTSSVAASTISLTFTESEFSVASHALCSWFQCVV